MNSNILLVAALVPAIILCVYVYRKDRTEKEPLGLLLKLMALGAVICFPAATLEELVQGIIDDLFMPYTTVVDGQAYLSGSLFYLYHACEYFIGVALIEEGLKFVVLYLVTRNNKNFNSLFDGIIYSVFVSLGFAALENVMYVTSYGLSNALVRAVTAVPAHMFFAVLMGYYYSLWNLCRKAAEKEKQFKSQGFIRANSREFSPGKFLTMSLVMSTAAHGLYDYCCTLDSTLASLAFAVFLAILYVYCFGKIRKFSRIDVSDERYAARLIFFKYPHLQQLAETMPGHPDLQVPQGTVDPEIMEQLTSE